MGGIHVLPEMMLHCVDGHEGEHHHVGWMFFHQVKTRAQPLMVEFVHLGQDLLAPRIGGHVAKVMNIELEAPEQVHQLRVQLERINERALLRWRIHAGNLEAVQVLGRIGEWYVHRADGVAGIGQHAPNSFCAARSTVQVS